METIPARVEEAGEGKWERSVGRKENSCVNINYFLKYAHPPPRKKENKFPDSASSHVEQTMFPQFGSFRAGSLVGFPKGQGVDPR